MVLVHNWPFFQFFFFLYLPIQARKMCFIILQNEKTPSWLRKQEVKKIKKLRFFQRGQSVVQVQNWPYFHHIFLGDKGQENVLYDILERKTVFQAIKTTGFIRQKIDIFPKGLLHGSGPKLAIFPTLFSCQYRPTKCVLSYCRTKKSLSSLKKQEVQKVKKWSFFQRGYNMVLVQNWPFFEFIFFANIVQQNVFYHILDGRNAFLG